MSLFLREIQAPTGDLRPSGLAPPFRQTPTSSFCVKFRLFFTVRNGCFGTFFERRAHWLESDGGAGFPRCQERTSRVFRLVA